MSGQTPVFAAPRFFQQEADTLKCGALATPCGFDWDGDGSADHIGIESREVDGAKKRIARPGVNNPTKLWSVRSEIKANVCPSGDHVGESLVPRA